MTRQRDPELELRNVREELDATKKKLERYTDLIARLYDELDSLRNNMCDKCKQGGDTGYLRSPSPPLLGHRLLGSPKVYSHSPISLPSSSSPNLTNLHMATISTNSTHKALPELPSAATPVIHLPSETVSSNYTRRASPPTKPQPLPVENANNSLELKLDWSVVHDPDTQRTLDLRVTETLTYNCIVHAVRFSRNGKCLAVGLGSGETHVYDLKTLSKSVLVEHTAKVKPAVRDIRFSPDDVNIATGLSNGRITIWNIAQKRVRAVFKGHELNVSVDFSPDGRFLVSVSWDNTIRLWCLRDGSSKKLPDAPMFNAVVFSPHGRYAFSGNDDGFLRIWDTRTVKLVEKWKGHAGRVWCVTLSKDGKRFASGGSDIIMKYWDVSSYTDRFGSANCLVSTTCTVEERQDILRFEGHTARISSICLSFDGRWIFSSGGLDCSIRVWDAKTGAWQCTLTGHRQMIQGADVSPTGQLLASGSWDGCVRLWEFNVIE